MSQWPETLLLREFRPREIETLTGHKPDTLRKWGERFDFKRTGDLFRDREDSGTTEQVSRWWTWTGVQMIAIFGDVLRDTQDVKIARELLMRDRLIGNDSQVFEHDYRGPRDTGDLFIVKEMSNSQLPSGTSNGVGVARWLAGELPSGAPDRLYIYNFSAMQRRLIEKLSAMDGGAK